jgi:hypothetical protein
MEAMQTATENTESKKTILWVDDEEIARKIQNPKKPSSGWMMRK